MTPKKRDRDEPQPGPLPSGAPIRQGPRDPDRRRVLRRAAATAMVAGAAGAGTYVFYDGDKPARSRRKPDRTIPDHRVKVAPTTPKMVIARGKDPAKNVQAALKRIGGLGLFINKGDVVLVKPNVGWDRMPAQAANTNPFVIGAVVRACKEAGAARVIVADHPVNDPIRCFDRSGITAEAEQAGAKVAIPTEAQFQMVQIPGKLGRWPVFEPFIIANKIINVPIAKHHTLTHATLGMKNWYGVLGGRRNQLHQRIDDSIAELALLMKPTLTVMDASRLLMRNGPTGGSLADVEPGDALAVSQDPVAVDAWAAELLGADLAKLGWLRLGEAKKLGVIDYKSLSPVEIKVG